MPIAQRKEFTLFKYLNFKAHSKNCKLDSAIPSTFATWPDKPLNSSAERHVIVEGHWLTDTIHGFQTHIAILLQRRLILHLHQYQTPCTLCSNQQQWMKSIPLVELAQWGADFSGRNPLHLCKAQCKDTHTTCWCVFQGWKCSWLWVMGRARPKQGNSTNLPAFSFYSYSALKVKRKYKTRQKWFSYSTKNRCPCLLTTAQGCR